MEGVPNMGITGIAIRKMTAAILTSPELCRPLWPRASVSRYGGVDEARLAKSTPSLLPPEACLCIACPEWGVIVGLRRVVLLSGVFIVSDDDQRGLLASALVLNAAFFS